MESLSEEACWKPCGIAMTSFNQYRHKLPAQIKSATTLICCKL